MNPHMSNFFTDMAWHIEQIFKGNIWYAEGVIFLIIFIESIAFIGSLFPGTLLIIPIGLLLGNGTLPLGITALNMFIAAFIGDTLSYCIGRRFHKHIDTSDFIKQYHTSYMWLKKHIKRYGIFALIIGRLFGPLRSSIPFFAGLLNMSSILYLTGIIPAIILWGMAYMTPGYLLANPQFSAWISDKIHLLCTWNNSVFSIPLLLSLLSCIPQRRLPLSRTTLRILAMSLCIIFLKKQEYFYIIDDYIYKHFLDILPSSIAYLLSIATDLTSLSTSLIVYTIVHYIYHRSHILHVLLDILLIIIQYILYIPCVSILLSPKMHTTIFTSSINLLALYNSTKYSLILWIIISGYAQKHTLLPHSNTRYFHTMIWMLYTILYICSQLSQGTLYVSDILLACAVGSFMYYSMGDVHTILGYHTKIAPYDVLSVILWIVGFNFIRVFYHG